MFYKLLKVFLGPLLKLLYRPWIKGAENIPAEGAAILASNHLAVIDSFFLPLMIEREVVFIGKADYFTGKGLKGSLVRRFMTAVGTIPVDRSGGKKSLAALRKGLARLNQGELFGIYPEGTRSPDGRLYRGKTGVARLALQSGASVLPVAMIGTNIAQPIGTRIPRLHRIGVVIGKPLDFSRYQGLEDDRYVLRAITDEIMYELMSLSGQEYVDLYAADVKKALEKAKSEAKSKDETPDHGVKAQAEGEVAADLREVKEDREPVPADSHRPAPGGRKAPERVIPQPPEAEDAQAATDKNSAPAQEAKPATAPVSAAAAAKNPDAAAAKAAQPATPASAAKTAGKARPKGAKQARVAVQEANSAVVQAAAPASPKSTD